METNSVSVPDSSISTSSPSPSPSSPSGYTHLAISGAGIKGIAILGSLKVLYDNKLMTTVANFAGSSSGGLICFFLSIGYTCDELTDIMMNVDMGNYRDINISSIFDKWGVDSGELIMKLVSSIAKQKNISNTITFKELHTKMNNTLILTGSNITTNYVVYYNHIDTPDKKVFDALRITISYPLLFYPIIEGGEIIIDGAMFSPYPMDYFSDFGGDNCKKIGILINNPCEKNQTIEDCETYFISIMNCLQERYENLCISKHRADTIMIDINWLHSMKFNITLDDKTKMFEKGIGETKKFLGL